METTMNQKGYALLIVLFLIVFIMTVMAVFIRGSISNAKQEKIIDDSHLSIVDAEMGVEYYIAKYENAFLRNRQEIWDFYYEEFIGKSKNKSQTEIAKLAEFYQYKAADEIAESLKGFTSKPKENEHFSDLEVDEGVPFVSNNRFIEVSGHVTTTRATQKSIRMNLTFEIPEFLGVHTPSDVSDSEYLEQWNSFKKSGNFVMIDEPSATCDKKVNGKVCKTDSLKNLNQVNNATIYVPQDINEGNSGNMGKISNSKVYVNGSILGSSNFKGLNYLELYVSGEVSLKNVNGQGIKNSLIMTQSDFKADHFETSNSQYWIKGKFTFNKSLDFDNSFMVTKDSLVGPNSSAIITKSTIIVQKDLLTEINLKNNSLLCVGNGINLSDVKGDASSHVYYIQGKSSGIPSGSLNYHSIDEREFNNNPEVLYSKCLGTGISENKTWERPIVDVMY